MARRIALLLAIGWAQPAWSHPCDHDHGRLLDVVTVNAWGLPPPLAPNRRGRLPRMHRLLREGGYDLVGLQEVWNGARRLFGRDVHLDEADGDSGLAFMSQHGAIRVEAHRFRSARGFDALKRKGFLDAEVELPEVGRVRVIVTHLQAGRGVRSAHVRADQVAQLLEHVASIEQPIVLMGDFNLYDDVTRDVLTAARLARAGLVDAAASLGAERPTYPGQRARLDRVYVRCSDVVCLHPEMALALAELEPLSDHRPVHVKLRAHRHDLASD